MRKCKICMTHRNDIVPETIEAIKKFPPVWKDIKFVGEQIYSTNIIKTRNDLLWGNSNLDPFDDQYEFYLFWDSDVVGTIKDFELMYNLDKPVVFGLYPYAEDRGIVGMVGGKYPKGYPGCVEGKDRIKVDEKRVFEGTDYWGGFGFCLIRKYALQKMKYPWIQPRVIKTPPEYPRGAENVFDDIGFCLKMVESGLTPVLDSRVNLKHIARQGITKVESDVEAGKTPEIEGLKAINTIYELVKKIRELEAK